MPAHQSDGSVTWEITPAFSILVNSVFTAFISGIGTRRHVDSAYG